MGPYSHCSDRCFHFEQDNVSSLGWNRKTIRRMLQKSRLGEVLWEVVRIQMYPKGRANKFCCCIRCEVGKEIVKSNVIPKFLAWAAAMNWDGKKAVDWAGVRESIRILILPILSRDIYYISKRRYSIENCGYAALESEKSTLVILFKVLSRYMEFRHMKEMRPPKNECRWEKEEKGSEIEILLNPY